MKEKERNMETQKKVAKYWKEIEETDRKGDRMHKKKKDKHVEKISQDCKSTETEKKVKYDKETTDTRKRVT